MITYFCSTEKSIKNLFELTYKIYKHNKKILIITKNDSDTQLLNDAFWKFRKFLPHGDQNDDYLSDQPVIISTQKLENYCVHIYFYNYSDSYDSVSNILWNPPKEQAKGKIWKEENGKWNLSL